MSDRGIVFPKREDAPYAARQSFKDQCDINRVLDKAKKTGVISHINEHGGQYGDFTEFDFEDARNKLASAQSIFYGLDAEVRSEFQNRPELFFGAVNDPKNKDRLKEWLPRLAEPGRQFPDVAVGVKDEVPAKIEKKEPVQEKKTEVKKEKAKPSE